MALTAKKGYVFLYNVREYKISGRWGVGDRILED
jgi:hypothetical protein